jgi:hypothetical protein
MDNTPTMRPFNEEEATQHFFRLLGELHHSYTALEHELTCLVYVAVTRLESRDDAVVAMLGGQRMSPLKDTIKRLLRVTNADADRVTYVDRLFSHLGELQFFRDRLTHYLTVMSEDNPECWIIMNFTGIKEREKMEDIHFNLFALHAAAFDLRAMRLLVGPVFEYRLSKTVEPLPALPTWKFEPSMLIRNRPVAREARQKSSVERGSQTNGS